MFARTGAGLEILSKDFGVAGEEAFIWFSCLIGMGEKKGLLPFF